MATSTSLSSLETTLRAVLPADAVRAGNGDYSVDGQMPSFIATPSSEDEVCAVLKAASVAGAAVIARGSGRHLGLGMPPSRYDVALDLSQLNRVVEYSPADLMVRVEAGVLISDLQRTLTESGQWLPLDPEGDGTIGGLLAANRSGPARILFGAARDQIIGMQVVMADGAIVKSGGRVVKNVAGYDLAKLHIGAIGTLGVITQATFKVAPLPPETAKVTLSGPLSSLMSTSLQVRNLGLAVNGIGLAGGSAGWALTVRFAGGNAAVARSQTEVEALAQRNSLRLIEVAPPVLGGQVLARASLPPTSVEHLSAAMAATGAMVSAFPTVGVVRCAWNEAPSTEDLQAIRGLCTTGHGAFVIEKAPLELKQRFETWGDAGADLGLMRRLKGQFDPQNILSPGRFVGGI